ncbi:hypothetical protein JW835_07435 [bacterium]|nr:hypothetical protein [bacterium]
MSLLENKQLIRIIAGILIGGFPGFLYYRFIRCSTGTCPITRHPISTMIYGAVLGSLIASSY